MKTHEYDPDYVCPAGTKIRNPETTEMSVQHYKKTKIGKSVQACIVVFRDKGLDRRREYAYNPLSGVQIRKSVKSSFKSGLQII
jgi:hypothetical protein